MAISPDEVVQLLESDLCGQGLEKFNSFLPDMTIQQAAAVSIRASIVSKWHYENSDQADDAAKLKFLAQNMKCKEWSLPGQYDTRTEMLLNGFKSAVHSFWSRRQKDIPYPVPLFDNPLDLLAKAKIGPGANIEARGGDFYTKFFASPLTCTSESLYNWYKRFIGQFPSWLDAEEKRIESFGGPRKVSGSRLSFVPKNDKISRCICTEPTLNTYFQLGLAAHLESRLNERYGISLSSQQFKNRDLARLGSITDNLITLDLSGASDSISLSMLRLFFPSDFVRWLEMFRCTETQIPGLGTQELFMVSSMGNGYTFPLQTMIFSCVVASAASFRGIPLGPSRSSNSWGVFGDDIICPRELTRDVIDLLTLLGFTINSDKSFVEGPFRESCGADFYLGTNIRGIYLKSLLTPSSRYVAINQLLRFETQTGIALKRLVGRLIGSLKGPYLSLRCPPWESRDAGIHAPLRFSILRKDRDTQSQIYFCLVPHLPKIYIREEDIVVPRSQKRRLYNPNGLYISFLQRSVNSSTIGVRTNIIKWKRKRRIAPYWVPSVIPDRDHDDYGMDWGRWDSVVESYSKELGFDP